MEEIDIIELLRRVKEGKAPKKIEINGDKYAYFKDWITLDEIYFTKAHGEDENLCYWEMDFDTKIKILDKPIIEELSQMMLINARPEVNAEKINEIIRYLMNK